MIVKNEINVKKKNLIFDIDGTLVYFDTLEDLIREAFKSFGIEATDEELSMQSKGVIEALTIGKEKQNFNFDLLADCWVKYFTNSKISRFIAFEIATKMIDLEKDYVRECVGARETIDYFKQLKYAMVCSTNWLKKAQFEKLQAVGLESYFSRIYTCENSYVKPDPRHFQNILETENFFIDETLMIGDSYTDVLASNMGIQSVLYDPHQRKEHIYDDASAVITDFKDLKRILK